MTEQQFTVLANLLGLTESETSAAQALIYEGFDDNVLAAGTVERIRDADAAIRGAYVIHGPMEFRITVGHRDTHRRPGTLKLNVGDIVRLVAHSTEGWVPIRVTTLPSTPKEYFRGVVTEQLVPTSKYQAGNGVIFSEDQVLTVAPRTSIKKPPRAISL